MLDLIILVLMVLVFTANFLADKKINTNPNIIKANILKTPKN